MADVTESQKSTRVLMENEAVQGCSQKTECRDIKLESKLVIIHKIQGKLRKPSLP